MHMPGYPVEAIPAEVTESLCRLIRDKSTEGGRPSFIYRKDSGLESNLILDTEYANTAGEVRYLVIAPPKTQEGVLGVGAYSKARKITHAITLDLNNNKVLTVESVDDLAVRIKNTNKSVRNNKSGVEYDPQTAEDEAKVAKEFSHLGVKNPVHVTRDRKISNDGAESSQVKSLTVMNLLKGDDVNTAATNLHGSYDENGFHPSTEDIVKKLIIPILEAYKKQIADQEYIHRDIKPDNIRVHFNKLYEATVNFLDVDTAVKIGQPVKEINSSIAGTAGYLAPEVALEGELGKILGPARDIFALGIILTSCINPNCEPILFLEALNERVYEKDEGGELLADMNTFMNKQHYYNTETNSDESAHLFYLTNAYDEEREEESFPKKETETTQNNVRELLNMMTTADVSVRNELTIDGLIKGFYKAIHMVPPAPKNEATTTTLAKKFHNDNKKDATASLQNHKIEASTVVSNRTDASRESKDSNTALSKPEHTDASQVVSKGPGRK